MNDRFLNRDNQINRLLNEYNKHKSLVIGVDFDNTLFDFHNRGDKFPSLIELIKECKELNFIVCLYTGNTNSAVISNFEKENNLCFDYINESPVKPTTASKPYFNILLDDRAGLDSAYKTLKSVIKRIKNG